MSPAHSLQKDVFGCEQFHGPQEAIVKRVMSSRDALVNERPENGLFCGCASRVGTTPECQPVTGTAASFETLTPAAAILDRLV